MNADKYLETMRSIQKNIIKYLKDKDPKEEEERFTKIIECEELKDDIQILKEMLHLLSTISTDHHRSQKFFSKIEKILIHYKYKIQQFPNQQLFEIFKKSKRILLFLFNQKLLIPDSYIFQKISKNKYNTYLEYFYPEFKSFMTQEKQNEIQQKLPDQEEYEEYRQEGENEKYICKLIRKDSIEDFVTYINQNPNSISSQIKPSIYETNSFLIGKTVTLIEYATFFGSIQIFRYLYSNNVTITSKLWIYSIHGKNADIIHFLEDKKISTTNNNNHDYYIKNIRVQPINIVKQTNINTYSSNQGYINLYSESVKCHHNKIAQYFMDNFIQTSEKTIEKDKINIGLYYKFYNYHFIPKNIIIETLSFLCKYDYLYCINFQMISNQEKILDLFLREKLTKSNISYLIYSIKKGNCELAHFLIQISGIGINDKYSIYLLNQSHGYYSKPNQIKKTYAPLILAIENGNDKIVDILLSNPKINPNITKEFIINYDDQQMNYCHKGILKKINNDIIQHSFQKKVFNYDYIKNRRLSNYISYKIEKSALQIAFEYGNQKIFEKLLLNEKTNVKQIIRNQKASDDFTIIESKTLLHMIIENRNMVFLSKLLKERRDIGINQPRTIELIKKDFQNKYFLIESITPLYIAIANNNNEISDVLLSNENIEINKEIKKWIITQKRSDIKIVEKNVFHLAVEIGNLNMIEKLISSNKFDINKNEITNILSISNGIYSFLSSKTALHIAICNQNLEVIQKLLECEKCNINATYNEYHQDIYQKSAIPSLNLASRYNNIEIFKLLLKNKYIDVNAKTIYTNLSDKIVEIKNILYEAISNNNPEQVKLLIEIPELIINDKYILKSLVHNGGSTVNETSKLTPLYYAVMKKNTKIVKILIENDNEIEVNAISKIKTKPTIKNAKNKYTINKKMTALQYAVENQLIDMVEILINNAKIDINTKTITTQSIIKPIQETGKVSFNSNSKISKNENKQDNDDIENEKIEKTALSIAIEKNEKEIVSLLLSNKKTNYNDKLIYKKTNQPYVKTKLSIEKSMLTYAAISNNKYIVENLLNMPNIRANEINQYHYENTNTNQIKDQQRTALTTAIIFNKLDSVKCLLNSEKVDLNLVLLSKCKGYYSFLYGGPNCECQKVAFHYAIEKNFNDILKLIIENKKVDLRKKYYRKNFGNSQKITIVKEPIVYFAVKNSTIETLKTLLSNSENSEININDISESYDYNTDLKETKSAFQYANIKDNYDVIKLLEGNNAKLIYEKRPLQTNLKT